MMFRELKLITIMVFILRGKYTMRFLIKINYFFSLFLIDVSVAGVHVLQ